MAQQGWPKGKKRNIESRIKMSLSKKKLYSNEKRHPRYKKRGYGYRAIHIWIAKKLGTPKYCEMCKKSDLRDRQYHWANISRKYKRLVTDWSRLCVSCHRKWDIDYKNKNK